MLPSRWRMLDRVQMQSCHPQRRLPPWTTWPSCQQPGWDTNWRRGHASRTPRNCCSVPPTQPAGPATPPSRQSRSPARQWPRSPRAAVCRIAARTSEQGLVSCAGRRAAPVLARRPHHLRRRVDRQMRDGEHGPSRRRSGRLGIRRRAGWQISDRDRGIPARRVSGRLLGIRWRANRRPQSLLPLRGRLCRKNLHCVCRKNLHCARQWRTRNLDRQSRCPGPSRPTPELRRRPDAASTRAGANDVTRPSRLTRTDHPACPNHRGPSLSVSARRQWDSRRSQGDSRRAIHLALRAGAET